VPRRVALLVSVLVLAACGGAGARHRAADRVATVARYGSYPPATVTVAAGDPRSPACRRDAADFVDDARRFLAHSGAQASYPADLYYMTMRYPAADFQARACDVRVLGAELARTFTRKQLDALAASLPRPMDELVRSASGSG
jgi:hypothetical protein